VPLPFERRESRHCVPLLFLGLSARSLIRRLNLALHALKTP
jgi:hypothetical protein